MRRDLNICNNSLICYGWGVWIGHKPLLRAAACCTAVLLRDTLIEGATVGTGVFVMTCLRGICLPIVV